MSRYSDVLHAGVGYGSPVIDLWCITYASNIKLELFSKFKDTQCLNWSRQPPIRCRRLLWSKSSTWLHHTSLKCSIARWPPATFHLNTRKRSSRRSWRKQAWVQLMSIYINRSRTCWLYRSFLSASLFTNWLPIYLLPTSFLHCSLVYDRVIDGFGRISSVGRHTFVAVLSDHSSPVCWVACRRDEFWDRCWLA